MKISTKGRYGLQLMLELAQSAGEGPLSVKEVSRRQGLSEKYLEQIIMPLSRAGLVSSIRGAQGGYVLARPAAQISAGEVLRAAEGSLSPVDCMETGCDHTGACPTCTLWHRIKAAVDDVVDSTTIADLLADADALPG